MALVPAHNEARFIADTVRALRRVAHDVIVVDDGSRDETSSQALLAGAAVLRTARRVGKGGALERALDRADPASVWLFADADLGATAENLVVVRDAVVLGRVDLAVGVLPPQAGGGLGVVRRFASLSIRLLTGFSTTQPLSGQRALSAAALARVRPLARGFGVETAMTIDAARAGLTVAEVQAPGLAHRGTGRSIRGFWHRGRQGIDILMAVTGRLVRRSRRRW